MCVWLQNSDFRVPFLPALEVSHSCPFPETRLPLSSFQDLRVSFSQIAEGVLLKPAQKDQAWRRINAKDSRMPLEPPWPSGSIWLDCRFMKIENHMEVEDPTDGSTRQGIALRGGYSFPRKEGWGGVSRLAAT